jgi:hypothetical protein
MELSGVRLAGLRTGAELTPAGLLECGPGSLDSLAWSYDAWRGERLEGCTHRAPKCVSCREYASRWREKVLGALRAARDAGPTGHPGTRLAVPAARRARPAAWPEPDAGP